MELTPEEKTKLKSMFSYLLKKKYKATAGHGGFGLLELKPILDELVQEGELITRPTIKGNKYFFNNQSNGNRNQKRES